MRSMQISSAVWLKANCWGEATATYLYYYRDTVESIKQIYGSMYTDLKIIAILRNPIKRAWSWYLLEKRHGINKSFFEAVRQFQKRIGLDYHDFIKSGMYFEQIKLFRSNFPQIKIFLFEEFTKQPVNVLKEIYQFLNLEDCTYIPNNLDIVYNASGDPKRGIYKPLYNFLFHENRLKRIAKPFIPFKLRQKAINTLANRILKKPEMPSDVHDYLINTYKQEILSLASFFLDEKQANVIMGWVDY